MPLNVHAWSEANAGSARLPCLLYIFLSADVKVRKCWITCGKPAGSDILHALRQYRHETTRAVRVADISSVALRGIMHDSKRIDSVRPCRLLVMRHLFN